ncbi:MAG: histidinol-phosphatase [Alphaproteobacteria bacterium]|nr:histidinol-phosphatase [Alphaproteobacteria bacterium]
MIESSHYSDYIKIAEQMADASASVIKQYFRKPITVDDKADDSPVTIADKKSELAIREIIEREFPSHGIIGEEFPNKNENAEYVWILDPIDGTESFITGKPSFGTLIALMHNNDYVLGIINQPITNERWIGVKGQKTRFNGGIISVRDCSSIEKSVLYATAPKRFKGKDAAIFNALADEVKLVRYSADCYAYGLLSMGFVDIVCDAGLELYDFAALIPVIEGAGGIITDWSGSKLTKNNDGRVIATTNKTLHKKAINSLNKHKI